jgi:hypothetical protein
MDNKTENLLKVKEIRSGNFYYKNSDGTKCYKVNKDGVQTFVELESRIIGILISNISNLLLSAMQGKFALHNTDVIGTWAVDSDTYQAEIEEKYRNLSLGFKESYNHFGTNVFIMSRSHFHNLPTDEQRIAYLTECHYESLVNYCERFGQDPSELHKGIEILRNSDRYSPIDKSKFLNKKGTHKAFIQTLFGYEKDTFRLVVQDLDTLEKRYFSITTKEPWVKIYAENNIAQAISKGEEIVPFMFDIDGWKKGDIFSFRWGDDEKYEFSLKNMELRRV